MVKFNLNEYIYVELNDKSIDIIKSKTHGDYFKVCIETHIITVDDKKYLKIQAYEMMYYFGEYLYLGCEPPIGLNIYFEEETLEKTELNG